MQIWKLVKNYEEYYEVSSAGQVRSFDRLVTHWRGGKSLWKGRILRPINQKGYPHVHLSVDNKTKTFSIHRLVAQAFLPNENNHPVINHKDGNTQNNDVANLEWCTISHNALHAVRIGLVKKRFGEDNPVSKLKKHQVVRIKELIRENKMLHYEIAEKFKISTGTICYINQGKIWADV